MRRAVAILAAGALAAAAACRERIATPVAPESPASSAAPAAYVGAAACATCHAAETALWKSSDHALAMQAATDATVLGDFGGKRVTAQGVTSTFARAGDGAFTVTTDGPDGRLARFKVAYTFGVHPLQQYLVELPGGRYQALGLAWDSRPRAAGGERWFHLYPRDRIDHRDPLHWTAPDQNWNYMCAECHSTDLQRGYDAAAERYRTTWKEIDVACEACHGPGSRHVAWAEAAAAPAGGGKGDARGGDPGLEVRFARRDPAVWGFDGVHPTVARAAAPPAFDAALETCARCHARRGWAWEEVRPGAPLADTHRVALLDADLYFDDGQIKEEVYEYGSFLESRMHRAGVTCADCHDPHSGKVRAAGNALCGQCHLPSHFDAPEHHHHRAGSAGARCVACHMPERTYMIVDPRRDHSLRVPRPDLDASTGAPDACTACHADRGAGWAAAAVRRWYPAGRSGRPHFGQALHAARAGAPGASGALIAILADTEAPDIVRATALMALSHHDAATPGGPYASAIPAAVVAATRDRSDFVRRAAAEWIDALPAEAKRRIGTPLLSDPIRTVRLSAAASLAGPPDPGATGGSPGAARRGEDAALARAVAEYRQSLAFNADRADGQFNLGNLERQVGNDAAAEAAYRRAIALDPTFVPAPVNLADLYAAAGRDADGETVLEAARARNPQSADIAYALGLLRIRRHDAAGGLNLLKRAAALRPEDARYAYVHAVALHDGGDAPEAIRLLEAAAARHPYDADIAGALAAYYNERGDRAKAARWGEQVRKLGG